MLMLLIAYPTQPQSYIDELWSIIVGVMIIVGICSCFSLIITAMMKRFFPKPAALPHIVPDKRGITEHPAGEVTSKAVADSFSSYPQSPQVFNITWLNILWMVIVFTLLLVILDFPIIYTASGLLGGCSVIGVCYYIKKRKYSENIRLKKPKPVTASTSFELHTCSICLGVIKKDLPIVKCGCGRIYHMSCIKRVEICPFCGRRII